MAHKASKKVHIISTPNNPRNKQINAQVKQRKEWKRALKAHQSPNDNQFE
ncbi:cytochrome C [Sesbania bispinosa]|nr:cytochrome C [Sesbania bispinosa]